MVLPRLIRVALNDKIIYVTVHGVSVCAPFLLCLAKHIVAHYYRVNKLKIHK